MRKREAWKQIVAMSLAGVIALAPAVAAAQDKAAPQAQPGKTARVEKEKPSGGPQEGIKVHGHWTIDVRNPDGTSVSHTEFENALSDDRTLVRVFTRMTMPGPWVVGLYSSGPTGPCSSQGVNQGCGLYEGTPLFPLSSTATASTALTVTPFLTATQTPSGTLPVRFELQGTATATANSTIDRVSTSLTNCAPSFTPAAPCQAGSAAYIGFSLAIATPTGPFQSVPVAAGQIIQVTVAISFS